MTWNLLCAEIKNAQYNQNYYTKENTEISQENRENHLDMTMEIKSLQNDKKIDLAESNLYYLGVEQELQDHQDAIDAQYEEAKEKADEAADDEDTTINTDYIIDYQTECNNLQREWAELDEEKAIAANKIKAEYDRDIEQLETEYNDKELDNQVLSEKNQEQLAFWAGIEKSCQDKISDALDAIMPHLS